MNLAHKSKNAITVLLKKKILIALSVFHVQTYKKRFVSMDSMQHLVMDALS